MNKQHCYAELASCISMGISLQDYHADYHAGYQGQTLTITFHNMLIPEKRRNCVIKQNKTV